MNDQKRVLLVSGQGSLGKAVSKTLKKSGYQVTLLRWVKKLRIQKKRFDFVVHLGNDPTSLTEGTRPLLEKAENDGSTFLLVSDLKATTKPATSKEATHLEALHFAEALIQDYHRKHGLKTMILRLATVFGPNVSLKQCGPLGYLIAEFTEDETATLTLYGDGKDKNYYLYFDDAVRAVSSALKIKEKQGGIYFAAPAAPVTSKKIAEILQKQNRDHEIRYHKGLVPLEEEPKLEGKKLPGFKPETTVEEGIAEILQGSATKKHENRTATRKNTKKPFAAIAQRLKCPSKKTLIKLSILLLIIFPFLYAGAQIGLTLYRLKNLRSRISNFDFQTAQRTAELTKKSFTSLARLSGAIPFFSARSPLKDLTLINQAGAEGADALAKVLKEADVIVDSLENVLKSYKGESFDWQKETDFTQLANVLKEAETDLVAAEICLDQVGSAFKEPLSPIRALLKEAISGIRSVKIVAANGFDLLGYDGQRGYLVLFQNSAELRAGGGFLGSLAHLVFKNGALTKLDFYDSFQLDSAPEISAPAVFAEFRGKAKMPLREANFFASFPQSGENIAAMFKAAQNVEIDGVLGINLYFVQDLLDVTGGFELSDFDHTITADNLFTVTTQEVEKDFFPGSTKKKRFLQALGEGLINNLFDLGRDKYDQLAQVVWDGLNKRHLLLYFKDGEIAQSFIPTGFDGRVKTTDKDYLMIIDSSFGSKANLLGIERTIDYTVTAPSRNDRLRADLTVTWSHAGSKNWPAGTYRNIFRALVPAKSRLISTMFKGKEYDSEIFTSREAGKRVFATEIKVKPQTQATLRLVYDLPASLNLKDLDQYTLYIQKQPGTVGDSFSFSFEEPFASTISGEAQLSPYTAPQNLQKEGTSLIFEGALERDIIMEINIKKEE